MLRACHDLLKPGGRIAFATIYAPQSVSPAQYRRAMRVRGCGLASRRAMDELLEAAGFVDVREHDVTAAFARSTRAYMQTADRYAEELRKEWGAAKFVDGQRSRRQTLALIDEGALRRGIFSARRPVR